MNGLSAAVEIQRRQPPERWKDAIEALPPDGVVLQLMLDSVPDEDVLARCRALRERRYTLALTDYTGLDERSSPLLTSR